MSAETLQWLLENWNGLSVGLLSFLALVGILYLLLNDKWLSPKSIGKLTAKIEELERDCKAKDELADKAADELIDARIIYATVSTKLEFLEQEKARLSQESSECRRQLENTRIEAQARERFSPQRPEGQS